MQEAKTRLWTTIILLFLARREKKKFYKEIAERLSSEAGVTASELDIMMRSI